MLGSAYIGLNDRYVPKFNISAESIERYLEDLVISTIGLDWSTNSAKIEAMVGTSLYSFSETSQFYYPYAACLITAALIYAIGLWSLRKNGLPAGDDFSQVIVATCSSKALRDACSLCVRGDDVKASERLENIAVRFGLVSSSDGETVPRQRRVLGFGTKDELSL